MEKVDDIEVVKVISTKPQRSPWSENLTETCSESVESTVRLSTKSFRYTWTISDFSDCLRYRNCRLISPSFIFENTEWCLHLWVMVEEKKITSFKVLLQNISDIECNLYFSTHISVVDDEGTFFENEVEFYLEVPSTPVYLKRMRNGIGSSLVISPVLHSNTLIVRSEFSSLSSEKIDQKATSSSKTDQPNASDSKCRTKRSKSSVFDELIVEMKMFMTPFILILCILMLFPSLHDKLKMPNNRDLPLKSSEINNLIFDSTQKLNLIAEALNLTSVKEKSKEILAIYSKMFNRTDKIQPVMQNISNLTQSLASKIVSFVASES